MTKELTKREGAKGRNRFLLRNDDLTQINATRNERKGVGGETTGFHRPPLDPVRRPPLPCSPPRRPRRRRASHRCHKEASFCRNRGSSAGRGRRQPGRPPLPRASTRRPPAAARAHPPTAALARAAGCYARAVAAALARSLLLAGQCRGALLLVGKRLRRRARPARALS